MPTSSSRKRQRCSHCRKTGHNKRVCPILHPEKKYTQSKSKKKTSSKSSATPRRSSRKKKSVPIVDITVTKQPVISSYVVNLRGDTYEDEWNEAAAYAPDVSKESPAIAAYDVAEVVSFSNKVATVNTYLTHADERRKQDAPPVREQIKKHVTNIQQPIVSRLGESFSVRRPLFSVVSRAASRGYTVLNASYTKYIVVALLVLSILPFPVMSVYHSVRETGTAVIEASTNAFLSLQSSTVAAFHANIDQAQYDLADALKSFDAANSLLEQEHKLLISTAKLLPIVGTEVKSRQSILVAGHHLALGNTYLVKGIEEASRGEDMTLIDRFRVLRVHIGQSIPLYEEALTHLEAVHVSALPLEYQETFVQFRDLFATIIDDMGDLVQLVDAVDLVFGGEHPRTHLLMFQNTNEWRPTGGFTGSFAVVDFSKGDWHVEVPGGGTYDLQGQLDVFVEPPLPLQLVNKRWEFQDANWFPDFAASAKKTAWFYERARGETIDGVIAIDSTVLERFLRVVGPQVSTEYDLSLDALTAVSSLEEEIATHKDDYAPKQVVSDLLSQFLTDVQDLDARDALQLLQALHAALEQGEIKLYFSDDSQQYFQQFGWTGELLDVAPAQDYLHVSVANIGGAKTDALIDQEIEHQAVVQEDGSILGTVIVHRSQKAYTGDNPLYNTSNISYVRAYVPFGAELLDVGGMTTPPEELFVVPEDWYTKDADVLDIERDEHIHKASGTRITSEFGKQVFGNWMITSPGESQSLYFVYRLPFGLADMTDTVADSYLSDIFGDDRPVSKYSLFVQKQSGKAVPFSSQIIYPDVWKPVWKSREDVELASNGVTFSRDVLATNDVYGAVFEHQE